MAQTPSWPQVVAHRGAAAWVPEHTLAGYLEAIEEGAEALECDVRLTVDGHLVCVHDPRIDRIACNLRSRFGGEVVHRGSQAGRQLFGALQRNRVNGLLIDQDIRKLPGTYVPFFGRLAWTPSGAAGIALKAGSPVVPAFIHRKPDGRHLVEVMPPLPIPTEGTLEERITTLTAAATVAIEDQVRRFPEQWVWMHRRWRSRPELELPDEPASPFPEI